MTQSSIDRDALLQTALNAAREASQLVLKGWRKHPASTQKGRIDLVTQFDFDSEALLRQRLAATALPIVGEEQGGGPFDAAVPTWYVDPIDGTTNFVHGHPFWCVSVGLALGGSPILGVVVAPALHVEYAAIVGETPRRDDAPCRVSEVSSLEESLLATGFPYDRMTSDDNNFDAFVAIKKKCQAVRRCGSAALDLCLVADGTYDGYWEKKVKAWDIAAGSAVVVAAGGQVTGYDGAATDVRRAEIVATNGRIHDTLLRELRAVRDATANTASAGAPQRA
jgi:myo-inositol-1(or 4)-monophosphatase